MLTNDINGSCVTKRNKCQIQIVQITVDAYWEKGVKLHRMDDLEIIRFNNR